MKWRKLGYAAALAAGFCTMHGPAAQAEKIVWRTAAPVPEGNFLYEAFMRIFAENVDKLTGGEVKIEVYGAGVLVPPLRIHEAVQDGTIDAGHSSGSYLVNLDPANAVLGSHPGGMAAEAMLHWLYKGGGKELWTQFRRETMGLHPLIAGIGTTEIFAQSNRAIRTCEDLKGLKHRTAGSWATILNETFGGTGIVVPAGEIFTMLERKGIDSLEWATPGANIVEGFHRIARYIIVPGIHAKSFPWEVVVKAEVWDALPAHRKAQLEAAAELTTFQSYLKFGAADIEAMKAFKSGKNEIIELDPACVRKIEEAGREWMRKQGEAKAAGGNTWAQRIFASYDTFHQAWRQNSHYRALDRD
ncbi:MAG: TRAP transporter substrate-binding protein DctP [Hyphomicrobiaceae bacterium]|nr:TRAP transporter substrate-binding protein DctP [Hyphomicrobiaceae bacterium]